MSNFRVSIATVTCLAAMFGGHARAGIISLPCYAPGTLISGDFVLGPSSPGKWGLPTMGTPGGTVTWSLMGSGISLSDESFGIGTSVALSSFMPVGFKSEIQAAFAAWSSVANIQFLEVADNGLAFNAPGALGDIRIGGHIFDGPSGTLAHGFFPPLNGDSAAGDIHFDVAETWKLGLSGPGFNIFQVAAHEIGHAIGLNHTGVANSLMNPFYTQAFLGPQADDIAGARFIYGSAAAVPEPSSFLLLGTVIVALFAYRSRSRHLIA